MEIEVRGKKCKINAPEKCASDTDFWKGKSFSELSKEQNVKPFNVKESGKNWPPDLGHLVSPP